MEVPHIVDRPKFVRRNEFLQARERWNVFVVALFGSAAPRRTVASTEPVRRRPPAIRPSHVDAVPIRHTIAVPGERGNGVNDRVLPVQIPKDLAILGNHGRRRQSITAIRPDESRRVVVQHLDLGALTVQCDAVVLRIPLVPLLPLVAAHPAGHQGDAQLIGHLNEVLAGDLALEAQHVQTEVLRVTKHGGFAVRVVLEEQVGCVGGTSHQEVLTVDPQVEIAAVAGELGIAILRN